MAGHSKWKQIKHKKAAKDQARGKIFSKLSKMITLAVIEGGGLPDPDKNVKLRLAIEKAKASNMPKENIDRAVAKAAGPDRESIHEVTYEAFGPYGTNFIIVATTDNPNRTSSEIRNILDRNGGKLGGQGSVSYMFRKCGFISFPKSGNSEEEIFAFAEKLSAFDIEDDYSYNVYFPFENLGRVEESLRNLQPSSPPEVDYKPQSSVEISDKEEGEKLLRLIEALEDQDDVQDVYVNFNLPEDITVS